MAAMASPKEETFTMNPVKVQPSKEQLTPYKFVLLVLVWEQFHKHRAERCGADVDMDDEYYPWVPFTQKQKRKAMTTLLQLLQSPDLSISEVKARLDPLKTAFVSIFYDRLAAFETGDKGLMGVESFLDGLATILSGADHADPVTILIDRCSVVGLFLRRMLLAYKQMSFSQLCSFQARLRSYLTGKPVTTFSDMVTKAASAVAAAPKRANSSSLSLSPTHLHPPDAFVDLPGASAASGLSSSGVEAFSAIGAGRQGGDSSSLNGGDSSIPGVFHGGASGGFPGGASSGGLPHGSGAPPLGDSNKDLLPQDLFSFETPTRPGANEPGRKSCVEEEVTFSHKQAEFFISQQTSLLALDSNKALSPKELQKKLQSMLQHHPDIAEAHFLSYLNSLRIREYCTAVHNLYHYFDRTTQLCGADSNNSGGGGGSSNAKRMEDEVSRRYAALNLAALHFNFGHQREAKAALLEAIRMAQECNDHVCLQHAVSWLNLLDDRSDRASGHMDKPSTNKALDTSKLHYLTSLGVQSTARHKALTAATPCSVFDCMMRSNIINCQNSLYGLMSISVAHRAALWTYYGNRECAAMCAQLVLTQDLEDKGVFYSGETIAISLCLLARHHADRGDHSASKEILSHARQRFPPLTQHAHLWQACEQTITFQKALLQGNWSEAQRAANSLRALDDCEGRLHLARLLRERGETTASLQMLNSLNEEWEDRKGLTPDFLCRVLLEESEVLMVTDNHTTALPQLTKCLSHATHHHLHYLRDITTMYLAVVQMRMKLAGQALHLLESCMLGILSHGAPYDCGRLLFAYAKCKVAASQHASPEERKTAVLGAVNLMTTAVSKFQTVQASSRMKDALYHQARLYHMVGLSTERNRCALRFKQLDQQTPTLSKMAVHAI